jgi:glycosyltransferase involved in cell wall biosynthesis
MAPQVSVIIPAYNGDRFIAEAVESALNQTYSDLEVIVIDDGSSDRTTQVLQPYLKQIRYHYQTNQGVAAARNQGLQLAQGEWIAFLDQDDIWLPNKIELQVNCLKTQPQVGIVHSGWQIVDAQKRSLSNIEPWHKIPNLDPVSWVQQMPILLSAMLFRQNWLTQVGGFNSRFKQACDVDLLQRLMLIGCQTDWVRQVTVLYRQHEHNDSLNTLLQAQESWEVRQQFFARADLPLALHQIKTECYYHTLVWIAWRLYYTHHFFEMAEYLKQSLSYTSFTRTETILQWIRSFTQYASEYNLKLDIHSLNNSVEWQSLINQILSSKVL